MKFVARGRSRLKSSGWQEEGRLGLKQTDHHKKGALHTFSNPGPAQQGRPWAGLVASTFSLAKCQRGRAVFRVMIQSNTPNIQMLPSKDTSYWVRESTRWQNTTGTDLPLENTVWMYPQPKDPEGQLPVLAELSHRGEWLKQPVTRAGMHH